MAEHAQLAGRVFLRVLPSAPHIRYLVCPGPDLPNGPVLVAVHGIGRDPRALLSALSDRAQQDGFTLIAPIFDELTFSDYQRLGRSGRGERADLALNSIIADAESAFDIIGAMHLFGFSGGAQFAHRYLYAWPNQFKTAALVAAGWYTPMRTRRRFPNGLGQTRRLPGLQFQAQSLLNTPIHILVGEHDTLRDRSLRKTQALDRVQGRHRVARAQWFYRQLVRHTIGRQSSCLHQITVLPNCGHDVVDTAIHGGLARHVFNFLQRNSMNTELIASA
ncbi:MAG: hypothetical protein AAGL69_01150 [Pseudomonadota bacterium]